MLPNSPKQLTKYLQKLGIYAKKKWGQNFLLDHSCHQQIIKAAELSEQDIVLEIGPGLGHLTQFITPQVKEFIAVEIDKEFFAILKKQFSCPHIKIYCWDVLAKKHQLNTDLLDILAPLDSFKLVANLPYNISAPVIINFLSLPRPPEVMVVTVQKEVAQRLIAKPSCSDYGPLSVMGQVLADFTILRDIPPQMFYPQPKVTSSIVKISPNTLYLEKIKNRQIFEKIVQGAFNLRRKTLLNSLRKNSLIEIPSEFIDEISKKYDLKRRGETLSIEEFIDIANQFYEFGSTV